jgi:hypothetical protein
LPIWCPLNCTMGRKTTIFFSDQLYFLNFTPETNPSCRLGLWTVLFRARPLMGVCGAVRMLWDFTKGAHWLIFDVFLKSRNRYGHTRPFGSAALAPFSELLVSARSTCIEVSHLRDVDNASTAAARAAPGAHFGDGRPAAPVAALSNEQTATSYLPSYDMRHI